MYIQDIGILLIAVSVSTSLLMLFMFFGNLILSCFEMPGQSRIPQDKWRTYNK